MDDTNNVRIHALCREQVHHDWYDDCLHHAICCLACQLLVDRSQETSQSRSLMLGMVACVHQRPDTRTRSVHAFASAFALLLSSSQALPSLVLASRGQSSSSMSSSCLCFDVIFHVYADNVSSSLERSDNELVSAFQPRDDGIHWMEHRCMLSCCRVWLERHHSLRPHRVEEGCANDNY